MGHVYIDVKLISPITKESIVLKGLIDTGATLTTIPRNLADKLQLTEIGSRRVITASGLEEMPVSYAIVEIETQRAVTEVLISEKLDRVLIGAVTLESLALKVDPKAGKLEKTELLLLWLEVLGDLDSGLELRQEFKYEIQSQY